MKSPHVACVDFETEGIEARPKYPPRPVGVSIKLPSERRAKYYAWAHPLGNNCTQREATRAVKAAYADGDGVVFHNAKFDIDVAEVHLGVKPPTWNKIHDTLLLAFLHDPHAPVLSLKPLAAKILGLPPEEQDALKAWILEHVPEAKQKPSTWGAYICRAPASIVGPYANGDVLRTVKLFEKLHALVIDAGMSAPYNRERQLLPVLLDMERTGVGVNTQALERDEKKFTSLILNTIDPWVRKRLKSPELNVDSGTELADAIDAAGKSAGWPQTDKGARSTSTEALEVALTDAQLLAVLQYRAPLQTSVTTFIRPWLRVARETGGIIHTSWNQVRADYHSSGAGKGARTGRLSSNPNFQNIIKIETLEKVAEALKLAKIKDLELPPPPNVRGYVIPRKSGNVINVRDYSQQEIRILGHYEDDVLKDAYIKDPWLDMHELARELVNAMLNTNYPRKPIKNLGFGLIYGMGIGKTATQLGISVDAAKEVKTAYLNAFPGLKRLTDDLKWRGRLDNPILTWGGRVYHVEPPRVIKGHTRTFEYKLLNVLIQGSAADCTKQALINYAETTKTGKLTLTVHDEIHAEVPVKDRVREMKLLQDAMDSVKFDVPMRSDGAWTDKDWSRLKKLPKGV